MDMNMDMEEAPQAASSVMPQRLTVREVAQAAGVSIKTVSRVLRGEAHVSPATRLSVEAAAQALGYRPDPAARGLKSRVPSAIGLLRGVRSDEESWREGHEYLMCQQLGAMRACIELDTVLTLVPVRWELEDMARELGLLHRSRQVGGFLLPAPLCDIPGVIDALDAAGIPYAAISPSRLDIGGAWVIADERSATQQVVAHVLAAGHRRLGLIRGEPGTRAAVQREAGCRDALAAAGVAFETVLVEQVGHFNFNEGRRCGHRLLNRAPSPTAIVACSDEVAVGVMAAAQERGLSLPDDLSVVGYDDLDIARKVWPGLTTVRQPIERMGEMAARQLIAELQPQRRGVGAPGRHVTLHCELVLRGSVMPVAQATDLAAARAGTA